MTREEERGGRKRRRREEEEEERRTKEEEGRGGGERRMREEREDTYFSPAPFEESFSWFSAFCFAVIGPCAAPPASRVSWSTLVHVKTCV
jgi:hypothetical protein